MKTYDFRNWRLCHVATRCCSFVLIRMFFRGLTGQDSVWQRFTAWWAFGRPVCTWAWRNCYELPKSDKHWQTSFSFFVRQTAFSIIIHHFPWFSQISIEHWYHWGSSRQHPMWSLSISISTKWRTSGRFWKGGVDTAWDGKNMQLISAHWEKFFKSIAALQTDCANSCKFWRSASCSFLLFWGACRPARLHRFCAETTFPLCMKTRHGLHHARMLLNLDIPEIATAEQRLNQSAVWLLCIAQRKQTRSTNPRFDLWLQAKFLWAWMRRLRRQSILVVFSAASSIDFWHCLTRGSTVGRHVIWASHYCPGITNANNQLCITV